MNKSKPYSNESDLEKKLPFFQWLSYKNFIVKAYFA